MAELEWGKLTWHYLNVTSFNRVLPLATVAVIKKLWITHMHICTCIFNWNLINKIFLTIWAILMLLILLQINTYILTYICNVEIMWYILIYWELDTSHLIFYNLWYNSLHSSMHHVCICTVYIQIFEGRNFYCFHGQLIICKNFILEISLLNLVCINRRAARIHVIQLYSIRG